MRGKPRKALPLIYRFKTLIKLLLIKSSSFFTPLIKKRAVDYKFKNMLLRRAGLNLGKNVVIGNGFRIWPNEAHHLYLDDNVHIEDHVSIYPFGTVKIGKHSSVGAHSIITTGNHRVTNYKPYSGDVIIGKGVFIGAGCRLLGPLTIGDNTMIAAGSTVTGDIPEGVIVASPRADILGRRPISKEVWGFEHRYYDSTSYDFVE